MAMCGVLSPKAVGISGRSAVACTSAATTDPGVRHCCGSGRQLIDSVKPRPSIPWSANASRAAASARAYADAWSDDVTKAREADRAAAEAAYEARWVSKTASTM